MSRIVRVCGAAFPTTGPGPWTVDANRKRALDLVDRAALSRPDIVCLPETFLLANVSYKRAFEVAEPPSGPTVAAMAEKARTHRCNIICPLFEVDGDRVANTAVVLNRQGSVVGKYRKLHPMLSEIDAGVSAGSEAPAFDLDFGRIGVMICFDIYYPDVAARIASRGVDVLFWSSVYEGGFPLWARAYDHNVFVVSAQRRMRNYVIDKVGRTVAECGIYDGLVFADIDLDTQVFCTDYNASKLDPMRAKYGKDVMVELYGPEGIFTLRTGREDLPVDRLVQEFGLERLKDYLRRSAHAIGS